jgi:hypothetical protein
MKLTDQPILAAILALQIVSLLDNASGQTAPSTVHDSPPASSAPQAVSVAREPSDSPPSNVNSANVLLKFKDSDIKFRLEHLMNILRDKKHEGWVLTAYPDPTTALPVIGAGFSLSVHETRHAQDNPLNPNAFLEPSSAQLWQAAGLDPRQLQEILDRYDHRLQLWHHEQFYKKVLNRELSPDLTNEQAVRLLRISTLQAIHNARAYCLDFNRLTASQQMALSQLVFQMGVNLEEFVDFLSAINVRSGDDHSSTAARNSTAGGLDWRTVQDALVSSEWAHLYTNRAIPVIAMFDPTYDHAPVAAEHQIRGRLQPVLMPSRQPPHGRSSRQKKSPPPKILRASQKCRSKRHCPAAHS